MVDTLVRPRTRAATSQSPTQMVPASRQRSTSSRAASARGPVDRGHGRAPALRVTGRLSMYGDRAAHPGVQRALKVVRAGGVQRERDRTRGTVADVCDGYW